MRQAVRLTQKLLSPRLQLSGVPAASILEVKVRS
jgi:hypothetical protein